MGPNAGCVWDACRSNQSLLLNYNSEAFMYRDLYSAIMCRPLLSAERQGENEEEKVRPGQRPLLTRAE
ncbi:hypothetical protein CQA89_28915 [Klebsiella pneumoniae]|nr:hypothetical protein CQA89_28915 [Klebsiella pneumoniae]